MKVEMENADRVKTLEVPDTGQIYAGRDMSGKTIRVAIEVVDE